MINTWTAPTHPRKPAHKRPHPTPAPVPVPADEQAARWVKELRHGPLV